MSAKTANPFFGFKEGGGDEYPCIWCGVLTTLLDAEHMTVCAEHQREYGEFGYEEMKKRYPLSGEDERNPEFFKAEKERRLARAEKLTPRELALLIERGFKYEQEYAQAILDGKTLDEAAMEFLGRGAEEFIDKWPE